MKKTLNIKGKVLLIISLLMVSIILSIMFAGCSKADLGYYRYNSNSYINITSSSECTVHDILDRDGDTLDGYNGSYKYTLNGKQFRVTIYDDGDSDQNIYGTYTSKKITLYGHDYTK